jgi:NAD(P)-dependent dehydrogenase (short-subunit alcohol dehydrogenase family)
MNERFKGQVVWITGGGTGLGRAMALEFASQGADVAVSARRRRRLDEVVGEVEALGRRGLAVPCDVTNEAEVEAAVAKVVAELGKLDVAVANAGFGAAGAIEKLPIETWRRQLEVNVVGVVITAKAALPELRRTGGRLALIGSVSGVITAPGQACYSASKAAVRVIAQTLSMELHGSGVTCTLIQPGFVESEIGQVDNAGVYHADWQDKRPKKLMWRAEPAARVMVRAIWRRKREFTFTGHGRAGKLLGQHAPSLVHFTVTRLAGKQIARLTQEKSK